jgi:hypothetical protein
MQPVSYFFLQSSVVAPCASPASGEKYPSRKKERNRQGDLCILTDGALKFRLGSGNAEAFPIRQSLASSEILLPFTDGA